MFCESRTVQGKQGLQQQKQTNRSSKNQTAKTAVAGTLKTDREKCRQPSTNHAIQRTPLPFIKQEWSLCCSTNEPLPRHHFNLFHHIINENNTIVKNEIISNIPNYPHISSPN
jgi:hypothetical protein